MTKEMKKIGCVQHDCAECQAQRNAIDRLRKAFNEAQAQLRILAYLAAGVYTALVLIIFWLE